MSDPVKTFGVGDEEPDCPPGAIAVVNQGDYRTQEVWVRSGSNIGAWYLLGNEHWMPERSNQHPVWRDVTARGPVTLMVASQAVAYDQGWDDGRARLLQQIESLRYDESAR